VRIFVTLEIAAGALFALAVFKPLRPAAAAVQYPAGWNLISGPEGSHVSGASGPIYSLQPGDAAYEAFPPHPALKRGWGYWAYFPNGGSLNDAAGATAYAVTLEAGKYVMLGDPSATGDATVSGADQVLTYSPAGGYQSGSVIPAGQGAFVLGTGTVSLSAPAPPAASATPTPTATPAPALMLPAAATSPAGLASLGLQRTDLIVPGDYIALDDQDVTYPPIASTVATYAHFWLYLAVGDNLSAKAIFFRETLASFSTPHADLSAFVNSVLTASGSAGAASLPAPQIGDEARLYEVGPSGGHTGYEDHLFFRRRAVTVEVDYEQDPGPITSTAYLFKLAGLIDARLTAAGVQSTP